MLHVDSGRAWARGRYRDSNQATRDYDGFPSLLMVTTSDAAKERFAYQTYQAGQRRVAAPLSEFLTTTRRIQTHPDGILRAISLLARSLLMRFASAVSPEIAVSMRGHAGVKSIPHRSDRSSESTFSTFSTLPSWVGMSRTSLLG
jgi:hypothetical protein